LITDADPSKFYYALDRTQHDIIKLNEKFVIFDKSVHHMDMYIKNTVGKMQKCIDLDTSLSSSPAIDYLIMKDQETNDLKKICIKNNALVVESLI